MKLKNRIYITVVTLAITGAVYLVYALFIAPNLIVLPITSSSGRARVPVGATQDKTDEGDATGFSQYREELQILFPDKNDWRTKRANMLFPKSGRGLLLFRNEPNISRTRTEITLDACTFILFTDKGELEEKERYRRAVVIETSDSALLTFSRPLDRSMEPEFDQFEKAELRGQVVIRGNGESTGPEDDFRLESRDVLLSTTQIFTKHPVVFQCGRQNGDGEELTISLDLASFFSQASEEVDAKDEADPVVKELKDGNMGNGISITGIELKHLNRLQFPASMFVKTESDSASSSPSLLSGKGGKLIDAATQIDVRCRNGVRFAPNPEESGGWVGRFMDDVEVIVLNRDDKHDCLKCKNLYLYFVDPVLERLMANHDLGAPRKRLPKGKLARLETRKIKAIRTEQAPAEIDSPRLNFKAEGDELIYDFLEDSITLLATNPDRRVRLQRDSFNIQAVSVCYRNGPEGKTGSVVAGKNGQMEATIVEGKATTRFRSSWKEALQITPDPTRPELIRVSAKGGIDFFLDGMGNISAEEVDFWGILNGSGQKSGFRATTDSQTPSGVLTSFTPYSAQFRGNIRLNASGGGGNIRETLTVRFQQVEPDTESAGKTHDIANASAAPGQGGFFGPDNSLMGDGNHPFELDADKLDLWVEQSGRNMTVSKLVVCDNVRIREKNPSDPSDPLKIIGDEVLISNPNSKKAMIDLRGNTASFFGKGLRLSGYHINVDQEHNSFAVVGPGKLSFVPGSITGSHEGGGFLAPGQPIDVAWSKQMRFDGRIVTIQADTGEDVTISQHLSSIRCPSIRLILRETISIFSLNASGPTSGSLLSQLELIECESIAKHPVRAEVVLTQKKPDSQGIVRESTGYYSGQFGQFIYRYANGDFLAKGPGWIRATVQNISERAPQESNSPSLPSDSFNSFMQRPWKHLHMTFQESLAGNTTSRTATVNRQVDTIVASSDDSKNSLDVADTKTHPEDAVFLNCRQLQISTVLSPQGNDFFELAASGNTLFRQGPFVGRAESMKYSDSKKMVYLEGNKTAPASIYKKDHPGAPTVSLGSFMRGAFNLNTHKVDVENYANTAGM